MFSNIPNFRHNCYPLLSYALPKLEGGRVCVGGGVGGEVLDTLRELYCIMKINHSKMLVTILIIMQILLFEYNVHIIIHT